MHTSIQTVTPVNAQFWLDEHNHHNRNLNMRHAKKLAGAMERGEWLVTPDGISFDENGDLVDGQHRLMACVLSGREFKTRVNVGVSREVQEVMDQGLPRNHATAYKLRGITLPWSAAQLDRLLYRYFRDDWTTTLPSLAQILKIHEDHPKGHSYLAGPAKSAQRIFSVPTPTMAAADYIASLSGHDTTEWTEGIYEGVGLERFDPRLMLRSYLRDRRKGSMLTSRNIFVAYGKAFQAFVNNREVKLLRVISDEKMPQFHLPL